MTTAAVLAALGHLGDDACVIMDGVPEDEATCDEILAGSAR